MKNIIKSRIYNKKKLFFQIVLGHILLIFCLNCNENTTNDNSIDQMVEYIPQDYGEWEMENGAFNFMNTIWGTNYGNVYIAGANGAIMHYGGGADVDNFLLIPGIYWKNIWGLNEENIYFVGGDKEYDAGPRNVGVIYKLYGNDLIQIGGFNAEIIFDIWGVNENDLFVVGEDMFIARYDGVNWSLVEDSLLETIVGKDFLCIWGSSRNDVYIAGGSYMNEGFMYNYDGEQWSNVLIPSVGNINHIWGVDSSNIFASTSVGEILNYDGQSWKIMENLEIPLYGFWGLSDQYLFVSGEDTIVYFDGTSWKGLDISNPKYWSTSTRYVDIWASSPDRILTVSKRNNYGQGYRTSSILHYSGLDFSYLLLPVGSVESIWGYNENNIYAVGSMSTLLYYNGVRWTPMLVNGLSYWPWAGNDDLQFECIWGDSPSSIFVGGNRFIARFNGNYWTMMEIPSSNNDLDWEIQDIWGTSENNVYAVGEAGILHYNGTDWNQIDITGNYLYGIWGSNENDVYAVGSGGRIFHFNGENWGLIDTVTENSLFCIWGSDWNNIYIGQHESSNLLHYDGFQWEKLEVFDGGFTAIDIYGNNSDDIYIVSDRDNASYHFDGYNWVKSPGLYVRSVGGYNSTIFAGGRRNIFRYKK